MRISVIDGALAATLPVAAHIPGGGLASMNFKLADRMRLVAEVEEALVKPRERWRGEVGEVREVWLGLVGGEGWEGGIATLRSGTDGAVGMVGLDDAMVINCCNMQCACASACKN